MIFLKNVVTSRFNYFSFRSAINTILVAMESVRLTAQNDEVEVATSHFWSARMRIAKTSKNAMVPHRKRSLARKINFLIQIFDSKSF